MSLDSPWTCWTKSAAMLRCSRLKPLMFRRLRGKIGNPRSCSTTFTLSGKGNWVRSVASVVAIQLQIRSSVVACAA